MTWKIPISAVAQLIRAGSLDQIKQARNQGECRGTGAPPFLLKGGAMTNLHPPPPSPI